MKSEALAYKFTPAGHKVPEPARSYAQPGKKLKQAFEKWLKEFPKFTDQTNFTEYDDAAFTRAHRLIKDIAPSVEEGHALLFAYRDDDSDYYRDDNYYKVLQVAGLFISAIYNSVPNEKIVYDFPCSYVKRLAYRLPKGKVFEAKADTGECTAMYAAGPVINRGESHLWFGSSASGPLINYGDIGPLGERAIGPIINYGQVWNNGGMYSSGLMINLGKCSTEHAEDWTSGFGSYAKGPVLNFGEIDTGFGNLASGLVINCGKGGRNMAITRNMCDRKSPIVLAVKNPESFGDLSRARLVLDEEKCAKLPELAEYLENLKQKFKPGGNDYRAVLAALDSLGPNPGKKVETDIKAILRRRGYGV